MGWPGDAGRVVITTMRVVPQSEYFVSFFRGKVFFCSIKTVCVFVFVWSDFGKDVRDYDGFH